MNIKPLKLLVVETLAAARIELNAAKEISTAEPTDDNKEAYRRKLFNLLVIKECDGLIDAIIDENNY